MRILVVSDSHGNTTVFPNFMPCHTKNQLAENCSAPITVKILCSGAFLWRRNTGVFQDKKCFTVRKIRCYGLMEFDSLRL